MTKPNILPAEREERARASRQRYAAKPEAIAARKAYYQRADVKERYKERAKTSTHQEYQKQYRESDKAKAAARRRSSERLGFPPGMFDKLLAVQEGKCAVCQRLFSDLGKQKLHADHCHENGVPRGLLCHYCNLTEGHIKSMGLSPVEFAKRLTHYLSNPPAGYVGLA